MMKIWCLGLLNALFVVTNAFYLMSDSTLKKRFIMEDYKIEKWSNKFNYDMITERDIWEMDLPSSVGVVQITHEIYENQILN